jgi:pimeloyl-ACP methyl ester carboxylesterase
MQHLPHLCVIAFTWVSYGLAQQFDPPGVKAPDKSTLDQIAERTTRLARAVETMQRQGVRDPTLADSQVFLKAAQWIVRHREFYHDRSGDWTLQVLDAGLLRSQQALRGDSPWYFPGTTPAVRGYRSRIDGSVQPYSVTYPADYGKDPKSRWRLDVVLHGRDNTLTEVKFIQQRLAAKPAPSGTQFVQLDIFGRCNNAYRWAGETDVFEAIDAFVASERLLGRGELLDPSRVVLRGFSMGGAGTWHLGLHRPDRWCVIGPGAGFSTTRGYWKELPAELPAHVESCLKIYDALEYAENAAMVPVVAYAGDKDPQLQAARIIQAKLQPLRIPMTLLIGKDLEHKFPPEQQKLAESEYLKFAGIGKGRTEYPNRVQFTTYTLKYPGCDWVEILRLDRHYERTHVAAARTNDGFDVTCTNVRALSLTLPGSVSSVQQIRINGERVQATPSTIVGSTHAVFLERRGDRWENALPQRLSTAQLRQFQKFHNMQGPIDDAFMDGFVCVRGTGVPWHTAVQQHAEAELKRFQLDWDKFFRGELPIKNDVEVTDEDIATKHLILFGDPASNRLIAQVMSDLPMQWTKNNIAFAGTSVESATHVPALVYPSPLNPHRYVVLNSGHTFRSEDLRGTNARLFPRYGDFALLKIAESGKAPEVVQAGLFDDSWSIPKNRFKPR